MFGWSPVQQVGGDGRESRLVIGGQHCLFYVRWWAAFLQGRCLASVLGFAGSKCRSGVLFLTLFVFVAGQVMESSLLGDNQGKTKPDKGGG